MSRARFARLGVAVIIMLALPSAACSLLVSVDGLSGGEIADARSDDAAPGPFDAGADADARSTCQGDACAQTDAGRFGFCASRTPADFFCADFDGTDVLAGWTARAGSGSADADDGGSTSAPFSLLSSVVRDGGLLPTAFVFKSFDQTVASFHLELDVEALGDIEFQYARLTLGSYMVTVGVDLSGTQFFEEDVTFGDGGTGRDIHSLKAPMTTRVWHHLVVDAVLTAPATATVHFDGAEVLSAEALSYASEASAKGKLSVGMLFVEPGSYATRFDNVIFQPK